MTGPSPASTERERRELPALVWLILPLGLFALLNGLFFLRLSAFVRDAGSELGVLENLQVLVLVAAGSAAARLLLSAPRGPTRLVWFLALAICLFAAAEEINWGQVYLGYATPDVFLSANHQQEVNLHNLGGEAGRLMNALRIGTEVVVVLALLAFPLWSRRRRIHGAGSYLPDRTLLPAVALVLLSRLVWLLFVVPHHGGGSAAADAYTEIIELALYQLLLLYLVTRARSGPGPFVTPNVG